MRVTLNLGTRPAGGRRGFWLVASLLGSVVLVVTIWVGLQGWRSWQAGASPRARSAELRTRLKELTRRQHEYEARLRKPEVRAVLERVEFYNRLLQRKTVSWSHLFVALERHLPERVRILAVTPELSEDGTLHLTLRVGAESAPALIDFLQGLEQGSSFSKVAVRTQERSERPGEDAIVAEISASYRGGG